MSLGVSPSHRSAVRKSQSHTHMLSFCEWRCVACVALRCVALRLDWCVCDQYLSLTCRAKTREAVRNKEGISGKVTRRDARNQAAERDWSKAATPNLTLGTSLDECPV